MEKRTKILLGVLGVLVLLAGSFYAYMEFFSGEEEVTAVAPPATPKPPVKKAETVPAEATPAETAPAEKAGEGSPSAKAEPQAPGKTEEAKAGAPGAAVPAVKPEKPADEKKAEAAPAAKPAKSAETAKAAKPAPCTPVIIATVKGKKVEFKTADEFVKKSGMDEKAMKEFGAKNLDAAKKKLNDLQKKKAPAADVDCAKKELGLADNLVKLVDEKFPAKPEKPVYAYSSLDKRDPFMSPLEIPKVYPPVPRNAPPLERIPSEQLDVDGIMWNEKGFRALIVTPDNRGYTVKVGDTVGNKKGKVVRISEKRVYVEERIPDIFGDIELRNIVLKLHKEAE